MWNLSCWQMKQFTSWFKVILLLWHFCHGISFQGCIQTITWSLPPSFYDSLHWRDSKRLWCQLFPSQLTPRGSIHSGFNGIGTKRCKVCSQEAQLMHYSRASISWSYALVFPLTDSLYLSLSLYTQFLPFHFLPKSHSLCLSFSFPLLLSLPWQMCTCRMVLGN